MFQPDPGHRSMGIFTTILPPHFVGGVAPSRHDVALSACPEKQAAHRAALAEQAQSGITTSLWHAVLQAGRRLSGVVRQLEHHRFGDARRRSEVR